MSKPLPAKGALLLRKQVWAHGGTEHLCMVHQATAQPALPFMGGYYHSHQVVKAAQKESIITWDLGLSEIKIWVPPPAKSPKPTDVLANEEGVLQRVEEKGDTDEHLGTNCSSKQ